MVWADADAAPGPDSSDDPSALLSVRVPSPGRPRRTGTGGSRLSPTTSMC